MPASDQILLGLTRIAHDAFALAVAWHVVVALLVLALGLGWRPTRRAVGVLLSLPGISTAILAFVYANPFNGAVFAMLSGALVVLALRLGTERVQVTSSWSVGIGAALVLFGWAYPHFLKDRSAYAYLYGAPTGLIPCPTLSLMIGFALIAGGLVSRAWSLILATVGLFYGAFGAARLGVTIDLVLLGGAACLVVVALTARLEGARSVRYSS